MPIKHTLRSFCMRSRNSIPLSRWRGFSLVEIVIVAALASLMFFVVQAFFSHGVRSTVKGTDTLESIRAASSLFSSIKSDLGACFAVDTQGPTCSLTTADTTLPAAGVTFSNVLVFSQTGATVTYRLEAVGTSGSQVRRTEENLTLGTTTKTFGVPRMESFQALFIKKMHEIGSDQFELPQVLVRVVVKSTDPRFPSKEVALMSVFCSSQLSGSNWNPVLSF